MVERIYKVALGSQALKRGVASCVGINFKQSGSSSGSAIYVGRQTYGGTQTAACS